MYGGPEPDMALRGRAAIVGIGETDYATDYAAARARKEPRDDPGDVRATLDALTSLAFARAVDDAGLDRRDVDGLTLMVEMDNDPGHFASLLDLPTRVVRTGGWLDQVAAAVPLLASGGCHTMALIFAAPFRTGARMFGGSSWHGDGRDSYWYYHPWRWSSQAAHWALMWQFYMSEYGAAESDLGHVALTLRRNAALTDNAVMTSALTMDDYLNSPYIVKPLRLLDICLRNDGAVCILMQRSDAARDRPHVPVDISGWGYADVTRDKLEVMIRDRLRTPLRAAGEQALAMSGLARSDIGHLMAYDPSSIHLVNQIEGFGFAAPGEGLEFVKDGNIAIGGALPVNTNGGMLSHSYMAGWNGLVEAVKQLRHEAGPRQVGGLNATLFATTTTEGTNPMVLTRGASHA